MPFLMQHFLFLKYRLLKDIDEKGEYIIKIRLEEWTCKIKVYKSYMMQHGSGLTVACVA